MCIELKKLFVKIKWEEIKEDSKMCSENGLNFIAKTVNIKVSAREEDCPHEQISINYRKSNIANSSFAYLTLYSY